MTVSINGNDISAIAEAIAWTGSIVGILVVSLIVYLMVRPPRHIRQQRKAVRRGEARPEPDAGEAEEFRRLADRMETRLRVLERALADQIERPAIGRRGEESQPTLAPVDDGRDSGRKE